MFRVVIAASMLRPLSDSRFGLLCVPNTRRVRTNNNRNEQDTTPSTTHTQANATNRDDQLSNAGDVAEAAQVRKCRTLDTEFAGDVEKSTK